MTEGKAFAVYLIVLANVFAYCSLMGEKDRMKAKYLDERAAREVYEKSFDDCHNEIKKFWEKGS